MATRWQVIIHYADVEAGTSQYSEVAVSTVAALSGYGSVTLDVTHIDEHPIIGNATKYARGSYRASRNVRYGYELKLYPKSYLNRSVPVNTVAALARKKFLWMEVNTSSQDSAINAGDTSNYHTTDYCLPVTIDAYELSDSNGYKYGTLSLFHRFPITS